MEKVSTGVPRTERVERFEKTNRVHLDLRDPLTRKDQIIATGRNSVIVERQSGDEMLDVEFLLPEGKVLDVPAYGVVFSAAPGAPAGAPPETIVVNRVEPNLDQAAQALRRAADKFDFDTERIEQFVRTARPAARPASKYSNMVFPSRQIGYLRLQIEVRENPDDVQINYTLYWGEYASRIVDTLTERDRDISSPTEGPS